MKKIINQQITTEYDNSPQDSNKTFRASILEKLHIIYDKNYNIFNYKSTTGTFTARITNLFSIQLLKIIFLKAFSKKH